MQSVKDLFHNSPLRGIAIAVALNAAKLLALVLLIVYLPACLLIAAAVVLTSSGPAFISRCYKRSNGQLVDLWEFRTECWESWQPTPLGIYLRKGNIHRLPALINVLRGDIRVGERIRHPYGERIVQ